MSIGTTSIDSLPISPQSGDNIRMDTYDKNIQIENQSQSLQENRDNDPAVKQKNMNQFVTGIQQASAAGLTELPSRDIPRNQEHLSQDIQIQPNHIPLEDSPVDYIQEHQTNEQIIRSQMKHQEQKSKFDIVFDEVQGPIMLGILYFIFQLPIIQKQMCKIIYLMALFVITTTSKVHNPQFSTISVGTHTYRDSDHLYNISHLTSYLHFKNSIKENVIKFVKKHFPEFCSQIYENLCEFHQCLG